ncbi:MAG: pyruvate formate lyase-activating protein [Clostridia bacterium]|nr:pyruvate formate lyase-activating protein [Clostridia bacterium]
MKGRIHSFESMACADGPGVRFAVFLQGCPLRCAYCHNPDTWERTGGSEYTPEEILQKVLPFRPYFGEKGGITLTGGEPLLQAPFTAELLKKAKEAGLHTVLDTSASAGEPHWTEVLKYTDLALVDIKFCTEEGYKTHCGGSLKKVLAFCKAAEAAGIPIWVRHVVVPGLTDKDLPDLLKIAADLTNVQRIELLPFRTFCKSKYQQLELPFPLADTPDCSQEVLAELQRQIPEKYLYKF